ncbi:MAG: class I SAM-dependent methyltransferase [Chloroflexota bacterium]
MSKPAGESENQTALTNRLHSMYGRRFPEQERAARLAMWRVLCRGFFQRYVDPSWTVLDLAAGQCEFINNITAARRIAVDANRTLPEFAATGVESIIALSTDLSTIDPGTVDCVFTSNFFEHLPTRESLLITLSEVRKVLRPTGRLLVLQPNIRYTGAAYWDFLDHQLPLTEQSLVEALELSGFTPVELIPRFLPYTTKSRLPKSPWLIELYLRIPLAWRLLGQQTWVVAQPTPAG